MVLENGQRLPPQDIDAEKAVLGACLADSNAILKSMEILKSTLPFYRSAHAKIFAGIVELYKEDSPIDLLTLSDKLKKHKTFDGIGGINYLTELLDSVTSAANVEHHLKIVMEKYMYRNSIKYMADAIREAYDEADNPENIIDKTLINLNDIRDIKPSRILDITTISNMMVDELEKGNARIKFNFKPMDEASGGMARKELTGIGSRPSHGKTVLLLDLTRRIDPKYRGLFISYEMSLSEILKRNLPLVTKIPYEWFIHHPQAVMKVFKKEIRHGMEELKERYKNIRFMYRPDTIATVASEVNRLRPDYIMMDHLNKTPHYSEMDSRSRYTKVVEEYLDIAIHNNAALAMAFQLSRKIEDRIIKIPTMADAKETGAIEENAENLFMLYREYVYAPKEKSPYKTQIINTKSRYGKTYDIDMGFIGQYQVFFNKPDQARAVHEKLLKQQPEEPNWKELEE